MSKKLRERIKKWFAAHYKGRTKYALLTTAFILSIVGAFFSILFVAGGAYFIGITSLDLSLLLIAVVEVVDFILLFIICVAIAIAVDLRLTEFRPRFFSRETGKALAILFGLMVLFFGPFLLLETYVGILPDTIGKELAKDILTTLVQTNGFLIAFVGVIFAQLLWAINNQQSNLENNEFESLSEEQKETLAVKLAILDERRILALVLIVIVMSMFVSSILLSLSGIAKTEMLETLEKNPYLRLPIVTMVGSLFLFVFSFVLISIPKALFNEDDARRKYRARKAQTEKPSP